MMVHEETFKMVHKETFKRVHEETSNRKFFFFFRPELEQKNHLLPQIGFLSTGYRICIIYN